ncbi:MAG: hypothetical protein Ta2A_01340 [Treponemataceae bacterium]|nr:MAG: hypothetical protein Ta2A_01340 [Treponemataceae bacterium]
MKNILILFFILLIFGCDRKTGASMTVNNISIPIEKIYEDIKENNDVFNYERIELEPVSPNEQYNRINVWVYGFAASIEYSNSEPIYLYVSSIYLNAPKDIVEFTESKTRELQQFFKDKYAIADSDFTIEIYKGW